MGLNSILYQTKVGTQTRFGYPAIVSNEYVAWAVKNCPDILKSSGLRNLSLDDIKQKYQSSV